jgi:hypothetical protein
MTTVFNAILVIYAEDEPRKLEGLAFEAPFSIQRGPTGLDTPNRSEYLFRDGFSAKTRLRIFLRGFGQCHFRTRSPWLCCTFSASETTSIGRKLYPGLFESMLAGSGVTE